MIKSIQNFLVKYLNTEEMNSYLSYTNEGNINDTLWIEKVSTQRDIILNMGIKCMYCNEDIQVNEYGKCSCMNGHDCDNITKCNLKYHVSV